jgi:hypothetical protein
MSITLSVPKSRAMVRQNGFGDPCPSLISCNAKAKRGFCGSIRRAEDWDIGLLFMLAILFLVPGIRLIALGAKDAEPEIRDAVTSQYDK